MDASTKAVVFMRLKSSGDRWRCPDCETENELAEAACVVCSAEKPADAVPKAASPAADDAPAQSEPVSVLRTAFGAVINSYKTEEGTWHRGRVAVACVVLTAALVLALFAIPFSRRTEFDDGSALTRTTQWGRTTLVYYDAAMDDIARGNHLYFEDGHLHEAVFGSLNAPRTLVCFSENEKPFSRQRLTFSDSGQLLSRQAESLNASPSFTEYYHPAQTSQSDVMFPETPSVPSEKHNCLEHGLYLFEEDSDGLEVCLYDSSPMNIDRTAGSRFVRNNTIAALEVYYDRCGRMCRLEFNPDGRFAGWAHYESSRQTYFLDDILNSARHIYTEEGVITETTYDGYLLHRVELPDGTVWDYNYDDEMNFVYRTTSVDHDGGYWGNPVSLNGYDIENLRFEEPIENCVGFDVAYMIDKFEHGLINGLYRVYYRNRRGWVFADYIQINESDAPTDIYNIHLTFDQPATVTGVLVVPDFDREISWDFSLGAGPFTVCNTDYAY